MSRPGPQPRGLARSRAGLLFALGMAVSLVSVDLVAQPDPVSTGRPVLHEKVHALRTRATTPDIIFVGNSHVHRTVVPSVFGERMATLGCNLSSYNQGIVGLRRNELPAVLDAVGSLPGGPPTCLVIGPVLEVDITYSTLGDLTARSFYRREDIPALLERWTAIDGVGGRHLPFVAAVYMAAQVPVRALHHRSCSVRCALGRPR